MSSRRELVISELVTRFTTPPAPIVAPLGLTVHRFAMLPIEQDSLPAIVVYWTACDPTEKTFIGQPDGNRLLQYNLTVRVECRITGEPIDQKLDPILQYVRQVVFLDPSLGGIAAGAREDSIQIDGLSKERVFGAAACDFVFEYYDEPFTYSEPLIGGPVRRLDYMDHPTEMTLTVNHP